jgi:phosphate uptake regulator
MLRDLIKAWRSKDMLSQMYDELGQMLDDCEWMFLRVCDVLFESKWAAELSKELYKRDRRVNKTERRIRKQIVEHLTVSPGTHVIACLVLMSVVKDAERVGDYCKNLFEIERLARGGMKDGTYVQALRELADDIAETFKKTRQAFAEGDSSLGHELVEHEIEIGNQCEEIILRLADDETVPCREAVGYTLAVRHMKRISAHLGNIASSVVMPIHKLDYFDEKWHK